MRLQIKEKDLTEYLLWQLNAILKQHSNTAYHVILACNYPVMSNCSTHHSQSLTDMPRSNELCLEDRAHSVKEKSKNFVEAEIELL